MRPLATVATESKLIHYSGAIRFPSSCGDTGMAHHDPPYVRSVIDGFDAEALLGVVRDARFEQRLLAAGHFRACLQRLVFPRFSLDSGAYTLPIFASGSFSRNLVSLALAVSCRLPMWANGRAVAAGQLLVFAEDSELNVRPAAGGWEWAVLLIERDVLQKAAIGRVGRELIVPRTGWYCGDAMPRVARELRSTIFRVLNDASRWPPDVSRDRVASEGNALLGAFIDAVACADAGREVPRTDDWMRRRRDELIRRAERYLKSHLDRPFDSGALAMSLGIGERRIERLFLDSYGQSPCRWHLTARLNATRHELVHAGEGQRVTDIALRMGFSHLGRFSDEYRRIFGEYPSETLRH